MTNIRYSHLRQMARSPMHVRSAMDGQQSYDSVSMRLGRLVHGLVLGGPSAPVIYEGERRGKAWADFQADHPGAEIVTRAEADKAQPIADAVLADVAASALLRLPGAITEQRIEWPLGEVIAAGTPDLFDPATGILVDLKTTRDAEPRRFQRSAWSYQYHAQLDWYAEGLRAHGHTVRECYLVAVETAAPYGVSVHRLDSAALEDGRRLWSSWLERFRVCLAADHWPGYADRPVNFGVPEWMQQTEETDDE